MEEYKCANCGKKAQEQQTCCGQPMQVVPEEAQEETQETTQPTEE